MNRMWVLLSLLYIAIIVLIAGVLVVVFTPAFADWRVAELATLSGLTQADVAGLLQAGGVEALRRSFGAAALAPPFALLALAVASGISASVAVSWLVTRPLRTLDSAMRRVGSGGPVAQVAVRGPREVEGLAVSFNTMVAELEATEKRRQNLLADVSHELRTPLTILQGNLRGVLDDVYTLDKEQIAKLYDHTLQLSHLVDDLHDLAQAEARRLPLHMSAVDLAALVEQAGQLFAPLAQDAGISLDVRIERPIPLLRGDRQRLMQVLQNLIANALGYAHAQIRLTLAQQENAVVLTVTDDGAGIPATDLPYVFDRFYRGASAQTPGTGLGLAIVQTIVQAHDGTIVVHSLDRQGTTFTVLLPCLPVTSQTR
jgi:signal transduction histidine kinase